MTGVRFLFYDVQRRTGTLTVRRDADVDMRAAIDLFVRIDPVVRRIKMIGDGAGVQYRRVDGDWLSYPAPSLVVSRAN
jgi:hypothetical protein